MADISTLNEEEFSAVIDSFPDGISDDDLTFFIKNTPKSELLGKVKEPSPYNFSLEPQKSESKSLAQDAMSVPEGGGATMPNLPAPEGWTGGPTNIPEPEEPGIINKAMDLGGKVVDYGGKAVDFAGDALGYGLGVPETMLTMGTNFVGAVPGGIWGSLVALREQDVNAYPEAFHQAQSAFTWKPGLDATKKYMDWIDYGYEQLVTKPTDKYLVDPNEGNPYLQITGYVAAHGLALLAPIRLLGGKGSKGRDKKLSTKMIPDGALESAGFDGIAKAVEYAKAEGYDINPSKLKVEKIEYLEPTVLDWWRSPNRLAKKFPKMQKIVDDGVAKVEANDTLLNDFGQKLHHIDLILGGGARNRLAHDWSGKTYKKNMAEMNEVVLRGDLEGKQFTSVELKASGVSDAVINAYGRERAIMKKAFREINQARKETGLKPIQERAGFTPHVFHNIFVHGVDKHGNFKMLPSARNINEAMATMQEHQLLGYTNLKANPKPFKFEKGVEKGEGFFEGEHAQAVMMGDGQYFKLMRELENNWEMSIEDLALLKSNFKRGYKHRSFGHAMERKGVAGWEKDTVWARQHYLRKVARFTAMERFKNKSQKLYEENYGVKWADEAPHGEARMAKRYINDILGVPSSIEAALNTMISKLPFADKFTSVTLGGRPAAELASNISGYTAAAKLGLYNASAAGVNLTQLMMSNAILSSKGSLAPVSPYLLQGLQATLGVITRKGLRGMGVPVGRGKYAGLLDKMGLGISHGMEGRGSSHTKSNATTFMAKQLQNSTALFRGAEFLLRSATGIGAFKKGLAEGMTRREAIKYARDANTKANFNYSIADTPQALRNPLGATVGQFKKFPIKAVEFMWGLEGMQHAKFWGPYLAMSGVNGIPAYQFASELIEGLGGPELTMETKKYIASFVKNNPEWDKFADMVNYGIPSQVGWDVSSRIGAADILPSRGQDLMGPAISSILSMTKAIGQRDPIQAVRSVATSPGNILKAIFEQGGYRAPHERNRLVTEITDYDSILTGLGIKPVKVSKTSDFARMMNYVKNQHSEVGRVIIDDVIYYMKQQDTDETIKALEKAAQHGVTMEQIENEMVKKDLPRDIRAVLSHLTSKNARVLAPYMKQRFRPLKGGQ